jgi:hypothetical protein
MEAMRQSWTDDRLDALNEKVDQRFDQVDRRFDRIESDSREFRAELKEMRSETNGRLDSIQRSMVYGVVALTTGMLAGFAAMVGLVATQL